MPYTPRPPRTRAVNRHVAGQPAVAGRARGRVGRALEKSPFWDRVASSLVSSLTSLFVATWVASSIAIISLGEDGSALRWGEAGAWVAFFFILGISIVCLVALTLVLIDGQDPFRGWRGWVMGWAPALGWLIAGGSSAVLPERGAVVLLWFWLFAALPCFLLPLMAFMFDITNPRNRLAAYYRSVWYVVVGVGILLCLCGLVQSGIALGATYVRATT